MEQNPITDRTIGFKSDDWDRFKEVRHKALEDYINRRSGGRKKGKPIVEKPQTYKLGELVVLRDSYYWQQPKMFLLVEVIDFNIGKDRELYYGVITKSSETGYKRISRIVHFGTTWSYGSNWHSANVPPESIKWGE